MSEHSRKRTRRFLRSKRHLAWLAYRAAVKKAFHDLRYGSGTIELHGLPYWCVKSPWLADTYAGINRSSWPEGVIEMSGARFDPLTTPGTEPATHPCRLEDGLIDRSAEPAGE